MAIQDFGVWRQYFPEIDPEIEASRPPNTAYSQGPNGEDWYEFRKTWPENTLCAMAFPLSANLDGPCIIQSVLWSAEDGPVPFNVRVLGITEHLAGDPTPWKSWQGSTYNPESGAVTWPSTDVDDVDSVLAKIQLSRMKMPDGETSVLKALRGILVGADEETNLWFDGAKNWRIDDPRVQGLGAALDLSPEAIQTAFNEAAKIRV